MSKVRFPCGLRAVLLLLSILQPRILLGAPAAPGVTVPYAIAIDSHTLPAMAPPPIRAGIVGRVIDSTTREPISNVTVRLRELGRADLSHADGSFHFPDLAPRTYTLLAQRIGYAPVERRLEVGTTIDTELVLEMVPTALEVAGVVVTGTGGERRAGETFRPTTVVGESEMRRQLEASLAATIDHVPGISQQYNGPAASQPVIRGMSGDRVLVLEDGQRTGDLSTSGGDHAVGIDPLTAQRVEVVRGPAGLIYGSNALGGVINVVREEVPRTLPDRISGTLSLQGETVNAGVTAAGALHVPVGRMVVRGELSGRTAGDTETPLGDLPSSGVRSFGGAAGASRITSWGYLGASARQFDLDYGIPGTFGGEVIPGAHEHGVEIESTRRTARIEAGHFLGIGPFSSMSFDANLVQYQHREIEEHEHEEGEHEEGEEEGDHEEAVVAASFDNLFGSANLILRHEHEGERTLTDGAVGLSMNARDLRTGGGYTGSRDARALSLAGYVFEELTIAPVRLQLGARYDWTRVVPRDLEPIRTIAREIPVRSRTFGSISASLAALVEPRPGLTFGASLARAFRTPSVEELFSDGPHLADYSFDIGNPDLEPEIGVGGDLFVRVDLPRVRGEISIFRNALSNYIYHAPTTELDPRFNRFPVFEARGADAIFAGAEAGVQWEIVRRLVVDGSVSYVQATRRADEDPLPAIPPLNGRAELRYEAEAFFLSGAWEVAGDQDRVPRAFDSPTAEGELIHPERPTAGYHLLDFGAGVRWVLGGRLHSLTLQIDNAGNAVWRDHLSRLKEVAPQPGRNVQALYRVQF